MSEQTTQDASAPVERRRSHRTPRTTTRSASTSAPRGRRSSRSTTSRCASAASSRSTTSSLSIKRGEILGLIGPNGAGKTTCFNVMTGVYTPTSGEMRFNGTVISGTKPHKINQLGIARTFQNIRLFPELSALENVLVGCDARHKTSVLGALFRLYRVRPTEDQLPTNPLRRSFAKVFGISRHTLEERGGRIRAWSC